MAFPTVYEKLNGFSRPVQLFSALFIQFRRDRRNARFNPRRNIQVRQPEARDAAESLLQRSGGYSILWSEKQKCGSLRVGQHPQACAGAYTTYTTAIGRTAWVLYDIPALFTRGRVLLSYLLRPCRMRRNDFLRCVGTALHGVFVFHPARLGAERPWGRCGEIRFTKQEVNFSCA